MAKTRTFLAIDAAPDVRERASRLIGRLQPLAGPTRWVEANDLHFTMHFLGSLTDIEIAELCDLVQPVAAASEPFSLEVCGLGAFPALDRPRTLWLGAGAGSDEMVALQSRLKPALDRAGVRGEERRFVPHLTLGRVGGDGAPEELRAKLTELADFDAGAMAVDELVLYASRLGRTGPAYTRIAHWPLGAS